MARQYATSAYSTPWDPTAKTWPATLVPDEAAGFLQRVSSSITSRATISAPSARLAARAASARPALISARSTRPMGRLVCRARCRRRSASSIGVTGWRLITGWRSRRWTPSPASPRRDCRTPGSAGSRARRPRADASAAQHGARRARSPCRWSRRSGDAVEGRADLVVRDRRADRRQRARSMRGRCASIQAGICGAPMPAMPIRAQAGEAGERARPGRLEEQHGGQAGEGQHFQHGGGAGEVVAVAGQEQVRACAKASSRKGPERGGQRRLASRHARSTGIARHAPPPRPRAAPPRRPRGPAGWAMMPPPAA